MPPLPFGSLAGSLQGIPTSIKDLFAVGGFPTYAGSPRRLPPKFEIDGSVVANLRRQLATVMGKTHMVEFAFGGTGQNAHYGSPRNPWEATAHRSPGGSSSGAGASLCEGSVLLALGTDTAASVRLPVAMTGNAGLKLTKDRCHQAPRFFCLAHGAAGRGVACLLRSRTKDDARAASPGPIDTSSLLKNPLATVGTW